MPIIKGGPSTTELGSGTADEGTYLRGDRTWATPDPGVGSHTHSESDVTGLVSDLAGKAPLTHTHPQSDVTGLVSALAGKAASTHSHPQSDVTNLVSDLAGKASTTHSHLQSDVTNLVSDLAGKAASVHSHAQSDVTGLTTALSGKSDVGHTHPGSGGLSVANIAFTDGDTLRRVTVSDAAVTASSKIVGTVRRPDSSSDASDVGHLYIANVVRVGSGSFDILVYCVEDPVKLPPNETVQYVYTLG